MGSKKEFTNSKIEIEEILLKNSLGFLSLIDDAIPYTIPMTYGYNEGRIILHCAKTGKKIDLIKKNNHVCFTIATQFGHFVPHPQGAVCHAHSDSVICFGIVKIIEDEDERCALLNLFNTCLMKDAREIKKHEIRNCYAVTITIRTMTARIERESHCTYYQYSFPTR